MLYLFIGDRARAYKKAQAIVSALLNKHKEANFIKLNAENYNDEKIAEMLSSQGLFFSKNIVLVSGVFSEIKSVFFEKSMGELHESENIFIVVDQKIPSTVLKKAEKLMIDIQNFDEKVKIDKKDDRRVFEIIELFGKRDRKALWVKYQELHKEIDAIEIFNSLLWQVKAVISARNSVSVSEAGLSPYVYTKSKSISRNFSEMEIQDLLCRLNEIQSESFFDSEIIGPKLEMLFLEV